jgi:hypothetical protein
MSDLPEDLSEWPSDPYETLGLNNSASLNDVRSSYARLIKTYRPETHPDHFQTINQAYQLIRSHAGNPSKPSWPLHSSETKPSQQRRAVHVDVPEEFSRHSDAELPGVYRQLVLETTQVNLPQTFAALFWLLVLRQDIDPERRRVTWLANGIVAHPDSWELKLLLQDELRRGPEFAVSDVFRQALEALPVQNRPAMLLLRWKHAATLQRWPTILSDWELEKCRLEPSRVQGWVHLQVELIGQVCWSQSDAAMQLYAVCRQEIDNHPETHLALERQLYDLDRLDELTQEYAAMIRSEPAVFSNFVAHLLPSLWNAPEEYGTLALQISLKLEEVSAVHALQELDQLMDSGSQSVAMMYHSISAELSRRLTWSDDATTTLIRHLLDDFAKIELADYAGVREQLLTWSTRELMPVDGIADVLDYNVSPQLLWTEYGRSITEILRGDLPLRLVSAARILLSL